MIKSFKYASRGIKDALISEPNLSVHVFFALIALIIAYFMDFSKIELSILVLVIFFVIILEMLNTVVEKVVDMYSLEKSEIARQIKDISAGVVLLSSICALIIGVLLFLPKL